MVKDKRYIIEDENLMKEWNWDKNTELGLNPNSLTFGSNKKAWWKCGKNHDWLAPVYRKVERNSCPFCSNRRILSGYNDLATLFPHLLEEWDYKKNKGINPSSLSINSVIKVNWKCKVCGNEWITSIRDRAKGTNCPKCASIEKGQKKHKFHLNHNGVLDDEELLKEWDYNKNKKLPNEYTTYSNESVWWKCSSCGYEWKSKIGNRTKLNRGCPCCANLKIVTEINDLATTNPELLKEWHPSRNTGISPYKVPAGSRKKVWWLCPNGHEYQASLLHRKHGTNCPICNSGRQTSFAEQCVFYYVKKLYPDAMNRYKAPWLKRMELDIFISSINYAIEYDGAAWHRIENLKREQEKYKLCHENNIKLIRLRENFAPLGSDIADYQFGDKKDLYKTKNLEIVLDQLLSFLNFAGFHHSIDINIERDKTEIRESFLKSEIKNSFETLYPLIAKEWHPTKNGILKPNMFKPHSDVKVWWICPVCKNEYQATIGSRSSGTGCPICGIEKSKLPKCKKVAMIDIKTNKIVREFKSISEASREIKINSSNISMVCKNQRNNAGGYYWKYVDD